jgi:hypothetical protein
LDETGGTPGKRNSVFASRHDVTGPRLTEAMAMNDTSVLFTFNEKLDTRLPEVNQITISNTEIQTLQFTNRTLTTITAVLKTPLTKGVLYDARAVNIQDCAGNVSQHMMVNFALPEMAMAGDLIINEVLFNPFPGGYDFVEIYNRSSKFIDLTTLWLANHTDSVVNAKRIDTKILMHPRTYIALSEDTATLLSHYPLAQAKNCRSTGSLPPMNDNDGSIAMVNEVNQVVDSFSYDDAMHSMLLKESEGVSLERISDGTTGPDNWRSANASAGFATPGYLNSNARPVEQISGRIEVHPEIFEPRSAANDFVNIHYNFGEGGKVANVKVFDSNGRMVRDLVKNTSIGTSGFFRWDGEMDNGRVATIGYYMVYFETFDEKGKLSVFRNRVAIAGKF